MEAKAASDIPLQYALGDYQLRQLAAERFDVTAAVIAAFVELREGKAALGPPH